MRSRKPVDPVLISNAVIRLNDEILDFSDAVAFLKQPNLNKNFVHRLISWLILFKIIPHTQVRSAIGISARYEQYQKLVQKQIGDAEDPLKKLNEKESRVIIADINRSQHWFAAMVNSLNEDDDQKIDEFYTKDVRTHAIRILVMLSLTSKFYSYIQGFDRYVLIAYLLGLSFVSKSGLQTNVAESISYFLSLKLLKLTNPGQLLANNDKTVIHFGKLDAKIEKQCPQLYTKMSENSISSLLFALRWQLLIFADEHEIKGLLYLWDNVILNQNQYPAYIENLSLAHISQLPPNEPGNLIEIAQHYRKWDNVELVKTADLLTVQKDYPISSFTLLNFLLFFVILLFLFFYLRRVFTIPY